MSLLPEVWLRGPLPDVPLLLQPVVHALLQALGEVQALMIDFPEAHLWTQPAGAASAGFHLQHLTGVLDRLFTYARGQALSDRQLAYLKGEGTRPDAPCTTAALVAVFEAEVHRAIAELKTVDEAQLTAKRGVGKRQLPSTAIGLYVHAAEHTMRHLGQLLVTVKVVRAWEAK